MVVLCNTPFHENEKYQEFFHYFPGFTLSDFQKWAIKGIVENQHVLITAHTGSGKTLPAEFAILLLKPFLTPNYPSCAGNIPIFRLALSPEMLLIILKPMLLL